MDEPKLSPFALTPGRAILLALGVVLVLIAISTARGGLSDYQQLKDANIAAQDAVAAPPAAPAQ